MVVLWRGEGRVLRRNWCWGVCCLSWDVLGVCGFLFDAGRFGRGVVVYRCSGFMGEGRISCDGGGVRWVTPFGRGGSGYLLVRGVC
jgi:hypothetical protein